MSELRRLSFSGTHREIGRAFGESCRQGIRSLYAARVSNALRQAQVYGDRQVSEAVLIAVAKACEEPTRAYHPAGFEELEGIAEGSAMSVSQILAMNGLTDLRDVLAWHGDLESFGGCTSFIVAGDQTSDGSTIVGQSWDLATDNMPHVVGVHRDPTDGPETWCLTTVGCLSLIGLNEHGVAMGTTNIRTVDARPGVTYLSIIHRALHQEGRDGAIAAVAEAPRAGAHYYYIASGDGAASALECTPEQVDRREVATHHFVHTNHCLAQANSSLEASTPSESSHARQDRLESLIAEAKGAVDLDTLKGALSDRRSGENAICRDDFNGISSNGAVIMVPERGTVIACHGLPDTAQWVDLKTGAPA